MTDDTVHVERQGALLLIGLNRPAKGNSFTLPMLEALAAAYAELDTDPDLRCGVLYGLGSHFTTGLDLAQVAHAVAERPFTYPQDALDPLAVSGRARTTPLVAVAHGWCITIGIELLLAADVRLAASDTRFKQMEVQRGIYPFGGATIRLPREAGWGNAMRWLLTGDEFDPAEALRLGLVQQVVESGRQLDRAVELAERIAAQAPLAVKAILVSARRAVLEGETAAARELHPELLPLLASDDAKEGVRSFVERRDARFIGR
jgi:enoyl-CoA hydratase